MLDGIPRVKSGFGELQFATISYSDTMNIILVTLPEESIPLRYYDEPIVQYFPIWSHSCFSASFGTGALMWFVRFKGTLLSLVGL